MLVHYLLISVICLYLLLVLSVFIFKQHRAGILTGFSLLCWLALLPLGYLSQYTVYTYPVKMEVINYSARKGHLYFFRTENCGSRIVYDFAVNANEESSLEIEGGGRKFTKVIFRTAQGQLFTFPLADEFNKQLLVWEKELEPADGCYQASVQAYRSKQLQYAIAIGLLILGTFAMIGAAIRK